MQSHLILNDTQHRAESWYVSSAPEGTRRLDMPGDPTLLRRMLPAQGAR